MSRRIFYGESSCEFMSVVSLGNRTDGSLPVQITLANTHFDDGTVQISEATFDLNKLIKRLVSLKRQIGKATK